MMNDKDESAGQVQWREQNTNGFAVVIAGCFNEGLKSSKRHVPSRKSKVQPCKSTRRQVATIGDQMKQVKCTGVKASIPAMSLIIILVAAFYGSQGAIDALEIGPSSIEAAVNAAVALPAKFSQPLPESLITDGSEWKPMIAANGTPDGVGGQFTGRFYQESTTDQINNNNNNNNNNTTELDRILVQVYKEPIYLPVDSLLSAQRNSKMQRIVFGAAQLNQSTGGGESRDQVVAESSPLLHGGRLLMSLDESESAHLDDYSIEKVIPILRDPISRRMMESGDAMQIEQPEQADEDPDSSSEHEEVREGGPGERRRIVTSALPRQFTKEPSAQASSSHQGNSDEDELDITLVQSANKRPPVYMSAPKHISELSEINKRASGSGNAVAQAEYSRKSSDLNTAAGHYKTKRKKGKKKKKKKVYKVKKYKKKKKKSKKKKKIVVVKKKKKKKKVKKNKQISYHPQHDYHKHHHYKPKHEHHGDHHKHGGKYYEYRSVPKKGAWEFGYKRGNKKHSISRKEHGHKSHFKTEVEWKDKKGKGHHVFDYNHGDHHKHHKHHHAAAATKPKPTKLAPKAEKKIS